MLGAKNKEQLRQRLTKLKREDPEELYNILSQLEDQELHSILYDPHLFLEDHQCIPENPPESVIVFLAGRGSGKSYAAIQWLRKKIANGIKGGVMLMAPTSSEVRDVIVYSTLLELSDPQKDMPEYQPSKSRVVWPDGTVGRLLSAERGEERVRGANNEIVYIDELGSIPDPDVFNQLMLTLRVGESRCLITTTPRNTETIRNLYSRAVFNDDPPEEGKDVRILTASTYANLHNLSSAFRNQIISTYEGTRLGKQELEGQLLFEAEGALWCVDLLSKQTLRNGWQDIPPLEKVAIGVDPATSNKKTSDLTGIVVTAVGEDGCGYVFQDCSDKYSPQGWSSKVISLYEYYSNFAPTQVVVESNQGGTMVAEALRREKPLLPVEDIFHTKDKLTRAQPVAMLYEQGKVFHVQAFNELEGQMTSYEGKPGDGSPDRMDAMVMSLTKLMNSQNRVVRVSDFVL